MAMWRAMQQPAARRVELGGPGPSPPSSSPRQLHFFRRRSGKILVHPRSLRVSGMSAIQRVWSTTTFETVRLGLEHAK